MNRSGIVCLACLAALFALVATARAQQGRSLPFNKQSVYSYFRQVEEGRRSLPENLPPEALQAKNCQLYASVLKQSGYDFEATIQNAVQFAERGHGKLDDPRFLFLAGVFQVHPDVFLRLKLISQATHDAVLGYLR
jgi:hypothetical protein